MRNRPSTRSESLVGRVSTRFPRLKSVRGPLSASGPGVLGSRLFGGEPVNGLSSRYNVQPSGGIFLQGRQNRPFRLFMISEGDNLVACWNPRWPLTARGKMRDATTAELNPETMPTAETTERSVPFVGQWNQLISTTNWEKGKIIQDWRQSLKDSEASVSQYADEAWSQLVGGVTPQHVGRLRRTSERFGHVFSEYEGLYWSHFYAAIDWDDAEMWLEGAVQSKWSVAKMRQQRWETLGKIPGDEPNAGDIVASEADEETQSLALSEKPRNNDRDYIEGPVHEGPDFGDDAKGSSSASTSTAEMDAEAPATPVDPVKHFEAFDSLPDDVSEAANAFKVAIITHKASEWDEISRDDIVGLLEAMKQLALAPLS